MYWCDGHRLHWAPTDRDNGFYCPKTFSLVTDDVGRYPDCSRVISNRSIPLDINVDLLTIEMSGGRQTVILGDDFIKVDYKHLLDALNGNTLVRVKVATPDDSIRGNGKFGEYMIMPQRML